MLVDNFNCVCLCKVVREVSTSNESFCVCIVSASFGLLFVIFYFIWEETGKSPRKVILDKCKKIKKKMCVLNFY